ncbi:MAG TPA: hypothetical protein VIB00_14975 [Pyrinomonadaceae bacterium]
MRCPRCNSSRIQRGYDDAPLPLHLVGLRQLLCNKCGLEFKGLDPLGKLERVPQFEIDMTATRRRVPRYAVHLPATIHLAEKNAETERFSYSRPSRGHCESISKMGLTLSFVGTKFTEEELSRAGQLLFVSMQLPHAPIDSVVSIISYERSADTPQKRLVTASFCNMSESYAARLDEYLERCAEREPVLIME